MKIKNYQTGSKFITLMIGVFLLAGCAQDERFPLLGEGWLRISECKMGGEEFDMIAQVNESDGKAVIAYFDFEENELYKENYTKDKEDYSDGEFGFWYFLDNGDMDGQKVLIKTNRNATVVISGESKPAPYRIWFWDGENYYCDSMN